MNLSIGQLAARTGVKVPTIRYYEGIGLMPGADRTEGNQRRYGHAALDRLAFIRHARDLGFDIDDIRDLVALSTNPDRACDEANAIARRHLAEVESRIQRLLTLKEELSRIAESCHGGRIGDCKVLESLADHGHCRHDHR
jgi:DNA-binding transcriptional MerR regulator